MDRLKVTIGDLELKNPVTTASGTFGYGNEYADFIDLNRLGGIFVKGTTLEPREGNDYPRMAETASGMLNAVGLQNKGVDYFVEEIYPTIKHYDTHVIVNVSGSTVEDYATCAEKLIASVVAHSRQDDDGNVFVGIFFYKPIVKSNSCPFH
jgi:dihydroorotate dehydrogenase (NAD+) catalytic subunit